MAPHTHDRERSHLADGRLRRSVVNLNPEDPSQELGTSSDFDVEAQPSVEAADQLTAAISEAAQAELAEEENADLDGRPPSDTATRKDTGELYGVRIPHAS